MHKKLLIIGYVWVEPTSSAAGSRMLQLIDVFIKAGYQITFASPAQKNENAIDLTILGIEEIGIELNSASFDKFIKDLSPTIVLFDRFMMEEQFGWRVTENCPDTIRVLDTEDLHFLRKTRHQLLRKGISFSNEALLQSNDAKREIASILRCDLSLIISSYEMLLLQDVFNIDKALLCHLPFLLDTIKNDTITNWLTFEEREHFVFIGNYFHQPNVDAVLQLKQLWKSIRKQLPKSEIHIYGAYVNQQIQQLHKPNEGFIIKGYTPNAIEMVKKAKVVLAPIRFGAGIKGKLTEAMLCGTPSVTTTIGAEGMHDNLAWNGFISIDDKDFVEKSILLYQDKNVWDKAQQNGITIINNLYDKTYLSNTLLNRIESISNNLKKHRTYNFLGNLLQHQTLQATKYMSKWIEEKNKY